MARKVLFLDFDGVLNSWEWRAEQQRRDGVSFQAEKHLDELDPKAVERVNQILERTGAEVVVSSTWRRLHRQSELRGFLGKAGFRGRMVGVTPHLTVSPYAPTERAVQRGDEIRQWLDWEAEHNEPVAAYAVLDDDSDMAGVEEFFVKTDHADGLQDGHVERCVALLGPL